MNKSYATIGPIISARIRTLSRWLAATLFGVTVLSASQAFAAPTPVISWQKQADGVTFRLRPGVLKIQVWTPRVVRVLYGPGTTLPLHRSLSVIAMPRPVPWCLVTTPQAVTLTTGTVQAQVDRGTGAVRFLDARGTPLLSETPGGRALTPVTLAGPTPEAAYRSQQSFALPAGEDIYGLGQHRLPTNQGSMSYRGTSVTLEQANREVAVPFLVSSQGYGLLWDNAAHTDVSVGAGDAETVPASASCSPKTDSPEG